MLDGLGWCGTGKPIPYDVIGVIWHIELRALRAHLVSARACRQRTLRLYANVLPTVCSAGEHKVRPYKMDLGLSWHLCENVKES